MNLEKYGKDLAYDIAFWLQGLRNPEYDVTQLGDLCVEICDKLRAMAIIVLLAKGNTDKFYHNLMRSGMARIEYLERLSNLGILNDYHQASGRYSPLVDTIASGDFMLARRLVTKSLKQWQRGNEYEDDYCYAQILHRLVQEEVPQDEVARFIVQLEQFQGEESSARLDVCRALIGKQQQKFESAFEMFLDEYELEIKNDMERNQMESPEIVAQRQVCVEGLAILRLAEKQGLLTDSEYRYCPSLARIPMQTPFPGD